MIEQIVIACTGVPAVWLSQQPNTNWKRYACLFGLAGQPFWFWSCIKAGQWGIFLLCILYTYSWYIGFKNNWLIKVANR